MTRRIFAIIVVISLVTKIAKNQKAVRFAQIEEKTLNSAFEDK